jgi:hypothetical protein
MLNEKNPSMARPNWIPTSMLLPSDGQAVFVRGRYNPEPRAVVFRRGPAARWEDRDSIYQLEYFHHWAAMSPGYESAAAS